MREQQLSPPSGHHQSPQHGSSSAGAVQSPSNCGSGAGGQRTEDVGLAKAVLMLLAIIIVISLHVLLCR